MLDHALRTLGWCVELVATFLYHEMLKRNTLRPMRQLIQEEDEVKQIRLLRNWAQQKGNECSYIQLAGGFLFTTVASCLQWPGAHNGHWSAPALLYASVLLALIAIVMGSQQLLVLPNERSQYPSEGTVNDSVLPQMRFSSSMRRSDSELDEYEKQYLRSIVARLRASSHDGGPNGLLVFVLQAPIMLLSFSVVCFLAGLCSVVFAPLGKHLVWGDDAKISVVFAVAGAVCVVVFFPTSFRLHKLFSLEPNKHLPPEDRSLKKDVPRHVSV